MTRILTILRTMFTRRWLPATLVVLLGMGLMIRLGIWQLDRLEERRAQNAALSTVLEAEPYQLGVEPLPADLASLKDRKVLVDGVFDLEEQVILVLQSWAGRPGVHLITPLLIAGSDTAVLVDRGWLPQEEYEDGRVPDYDVTNPGVFEGTVALPQTLSRTGDPAAEAAGPQAEVYRIDIAALQAQMPYELLPVYMKQAPAAGPAELPYRQAPEIDLSEGPHLSYAIQWALFTLILGGGYFILVNRSLKKQKEPAALPVQDPQPHNQSKPS